MADDSTATLSHPGQGWHMLWPTGGLPDFQLDVVGFLAILGEDAVKKTSRLASLSWTFLLPRLIPAPHSLLYSERPEEMDVYRANVCSVHSGNARDHLSHVAGAIFGPMATFTVRCCEMKIRDTPYGAPDSASLTASWRGPVVIANMLGCVLSLILLVVSLVFGDGMSLLATLLLSTVSVFVGITNRWQMTLPKRPSTRHSPPGDVVIRWPNGSLLVIRCSENVARELFFFPQQVNYTLNWTNGFIFLSLIGTVFLMVSVVALANAKIQLQIAWAGSFVFLNIAHWVAAALPRKLNWDFSAYELVEQSVDGGPHNKSFVETLWKAIVLTKSTRWIRQTDAAPRTEGWDMWLHEAEHEAKRYDSRFDKLQSPMWDSNDGRGRVWMVPQDWDPRNALHTIMMQERDREMREVV